MPEQKRVLITHADGREYSIPERAFTDARLHPRGAGSYADQGFAIASYEDGTPYDGPKTKRAIDKAAEEKAARRQATPAPKPGPAAEKGKGA